MKLRVSMETYISGAKMVVSAFAIWPLPPDTKPLYVWGHDLWWWWFTVIHVVLESTAGLYNIYLNLDDPYLVIKVTAEYVCVISTVIKMMICRLKAPLLQGLLAELYEFLKHATNEEKEVIQFYMDKSTSIYLISFTCGSIGLLAYSVAPALFQDQILPGSTLYPFSIEPFWIWATLYASHILIAVQIGATVVLDFMYIMLLWFTVARFEIICLEFQRASNADDIKRCIRKHQELLDYTDKLCTVLRPMGVAVLSLAIFGVTTGGFMLIRNPPLMDLVKHMMYNLAGGNQLFIFTWPADYLMDMSVKVRDSAYSSAWFGKPEMYKNIVFVVHRSQLPMVIEINGFLPALSLELFGNAVSATFSYLTMLRAVTAE